MTHVRRIRALSEFSCLGDQCPDTCCFGWSMQLDAPTLARYRKDAPELLDAVAPGEPGAPWVMRRDAQTGYCVKLDGGWCGIHKTRGENFLGDACYFYPRATRKLGDVTLMTATLSCPEIARLLLAETQGCAWDDGDASRLPSEIKDYLPPPLSAAEALAIHDAFLRALGDDSVRAEQAFARIMTASFSLARINVSLWPKAAEGYLRLADGMRPPPQANAADPFNLLHALAGLIVASHKPMPKRLTETVGDMERALAVTLDWNTVSIRADEKSAAAYAAIKKMWDEKFSAHFDGILRRWLAAQLSLSLYPFAGLGATISERIAIIGVRLATFRLALMCSCGIHGAVPPQDVVVRIAQSLARFLDHLGDATFSLAIYKETGWVEEARLCGLLEIPSAPLT